MGDDRLAAYATAFERLTPATLDDLVALVADDVHFRDPFNDVRGASGFRAVMADMFETLEQIDFTVHDRAVTQDGGKGFLAWTMRAARKGGAPFVIEGTTIVTLAADGRVAAHVDHWDAASQLYERVPVLGFILKRLRARLAA